MENILNSCVNTSKMMGLTQQSCVYKQVGGNAKRHNTDIKAICKI